MPSPASDIESFERVARAAVDAAGARLLAAWRGRRVIEHKGVIDIVTETDREIETLVVARLREAFPDHLIVAEEASAGAALRSPAEGQFVWYLDPLDGTTNFAHGYPQCAISLALARGTELVLGIVHDALRGETFCAQHAGGATLNGEPIHVSATDDLEQALLGTGFPYDRREHLDFYLGFLAAFMRRAQGIRRGGSAALDLCYVACGRFDGFWEWKLKPWDTAAGVLIVREAGGMVTDFTAGPFNLYGAQTLASNGRLHRVMSEMLTERLAEQT